MNITVPAIVSGLTALKDGTIKVTLSLQEIQPEMAARAFALNNQYVKAYLTTENVTQEIEESIGEWTLEHETKSPSKRLRNVLYRLWEQDKQGYEDYELFYVNRMNKIIEQIKNKLI
jgi:hypothetical protein